MEHPNYPSPEESPGFQTVPPTTVTFVPGGNLDGRRHNGLDFDEDEVMQVGTPINGLEAALEAAATPLPADEEGENELGHAVTSRNPKMGTNVIVDQTPLQNQMEKNKESLKVKLMVRRPITALVAQGILPSPKTSPALHEQRQKLERAKMGDMLRAKIARRPDRSELVHRHILEDVRPGVDPSLCDKQRQLKRAKLIDTLSNQLQARPGPLELVAKNILHDDCMEQALKDDDDLHEILSNDDEIESLILEVVDKVLEYQRAIKYKPTNEGLPAKHVDLPQTYFTAGGGADDTCTDTSEPNSPSQQSQCGDVTTALTSPVSLTSPPSTPSNAANASGGAVSKVVKSESHDTIFLSGQSPSTIQHSHREHPLTPGSSRQSLQGSSKDSDLFKSLHKRRASDVTVTSARAVDVCSPAPAAAAREIQTSNRLSSSYSQRGAPGKDPRTKSKKSKGKSSGSGMFKFHEYKGPGTQTKKAPSTSSPDQTDLHKPSTSSSSTSTPSSVSEIKLKTSKAQGSDETSYELLLKQQQTYLQWQLEHNSKKYPKILPATSTSSGVGGVGSNSSTSASTSAEASRAATPIRLTPHEVANAAKMLKRIDDMKVNELKSELRKRNLAVTGSKLQLVDRLRPHLEAVVSSVVAKGGEAALIATALAAQPRRLAPRPQMSTKIAEVAAVFSTPPHQPLGTPHGHTPPHHLAGSATPIRPDSRASTIFSPAPPSSPAVFSIGSPGLLVAATASAKEGSPGFGPMELSVGSPHPPPTPGSTHSGGVKEEADLDDLNRLLELQQQGSIHRGDGDMDTESCYSIPTPPPMPPKPRQVVHRGFGDPGAGLHQSPAPTPAPPPPPPPPPPAPTQTVTAGAKMFAKGLMNSGNVALLKQRIEENSQQQHLHRPPVRPPDTLIQVTLPAGTQAVPSTIPHSGSSSISGSSSVASNEELIRRQQAEIEQLKRSLEVSQNALKEQQMALQLTQQNNEQIILSQQLRNNQMQLQSIQRQIFEQNSLMASYQQQQQQLTPAPSPAPSVVSNCSGTSSVAAMEQKVLTPVGPFSPQHHQQAVMDACSNAGLLVSTKKVTLDGVAFNNLSPLEEKTMDADKLILKQVVMDKPRAVSIIRSNPIVQQQECTFKMPGPPPVTTPAPAGVGIQDHQLAGVQFHPTKASHTRHSQDSIASSTASSSGCPPSSSSATSTSSSSAHGGMHGVDQRLTIEGATGNLQDDFDDIFSGLGDLTGYNPVNSDMSCATDDFTSGLFSATNSETSGVASCSSSTASTSINHSSSSSQPQMAQHSASMPPPPPPPPANTSQSQAVATTGIDFDIDFIDQVISSRTPLSSNSGDDVSMEPSDVAGFLNSIEPSSVQQQQQQAVDTPALNNYSGVNQQQLVNQVNNNNNTSFGATSGISDVLVGNDGEPELILTTFGGLPCWETAGTL